VHNRVRVKLMKKMIIEDFKLIKNRLRPEFCFSYEKRIKGTKYTIFTMNGGKTYLASVEEKRLDNMFYTEKSKTVLNIDDALTFFSLTPGY